jgi:hypothetical protein
MTPVPPAAAAPRHTVGLGQRIVNVYGNFFGTINMGDQLVESRAPAERKRLLQAIRELVEIPLRDQLAGPPLAIPLQSCPSAVSGRSPEEGTASTSLPPGTLVGEVFRDERQKLLILGEGGSGKKTALRLLALELVARAEADETVPIPLILGLGSWDGRNARLADWLVRELSRPGPYELSAKRANWWIEQEKVLPLLWGLDTVELSRRAECLDEMNRYRESRDVTRDMAVTCRDDDYEALSPRRLSLRGAIRLLPLTPQQVDEHLAALGLDALRADVSADPTLGTLAGSPVALSFLASRYRDRAGGHAPPSGDAGTEARVQRVVEDYVTSRLDDRDPNASCTREQITRWLGWIAVSLSRGERTFYLDRLQPDWLPSRSARVTYAIADRASAALLVGCLFGLLFGLHFGLELVLVGAPAGALVGGLLGGRDPTSDNPVARAFVGRVLSGLFIAGTASAIITGLTIGSFAMASGVLGALAGALGAGLAGGPGVRPRAIVLKGPVDWSLALALRHAAGGFVIGSSLGALVGFLGLRLGRVELRTAAADRLDETGLTLLAAVLVGVLFGLIAALGFGMLGGLTAGIVEEQRRPNQAIRRSGRRALQVAAGVVLGTVPLVTAVLTLVGGSPRLLDNVGFAAQASLLIGPILGIVAALAFGGYAVLSHATLRLVLWRCGVAPLAYVSFLEEAKRCELLSRVGGGYEFRPALLEYFARRYRASA